MANVKATYIIHDSKGNLAKKAEGIALGLTIGSWTELPQLEKEQLKKHKGEVISVQEMEVSNRVDQYLGFSGKRGLVTISYPIENFTLDIPAILTTVFGKLSLDGEVKLVDLEFNKDIKTRFPGPAFGIEGIRNLLGVYDRPLLMSIFKGIIGRDLTYLKQQLKEQVIGGVDIVKDDEILFDNPLTPFEDRLIAGKEILKDIYEKTGQKALYAVNLTGRTFELMNKARLAKELGADVLLFNVFAYGLDVLQSLVEEKLEIPIMAHPAVSGALTPSEFYGIKTPLLLGKLLRMTGADFSLFPSPYGSVALNREEALGIGHELTREDVYKRTIPVPSAGIHPGLVPLLIRDFGVDSIINAGGGVHGHPDGTIEGGRAFRAAITAVMNNQSLEEAKLESEALKTALDLWGIGEVK